MHGPMWHGPSMVEALVGLGPVDAAAHPIAGAHSIWELVLHIGAWATISQARLLGNSWIDPSEDENFPPPSTRRGVREWTAAQRRTVAAYESLAAIVRPLPAERLDELVAGHEYSTATMLHGVVEHGVYHVGQIVLLSRALNLGRR